MSTKAVRQAIIAALQTIDGTGDYTYDLSRTAPPQVESGRRQAPPHNRLPYATVYLASSGETDRGVPTNALEQRASYIVTAWAATKPHHAGSRQDAAEDLIDDITLALRRRPTLNLDRTVSHTRNLVPLTPEDQTPGPGSTALAIVVGTVTVTWRELRP
jgi:hypothetical protein